MRSGMLNVMAQSLDEFMRTPQFLEMMKSTMDGAMQLKGMTREGLHKMQDQFEIPHKEDLDGVLLALRHVERRLLERIEDLEGSMSVLDKRAAETNKELERIDERIGDLKSAAVPVKSSSSTTDVAPAAKGPDQPKKTTTKAAAPKGRKKPQ